MGKYKRTMDTTSNSSVYNKARKHFLQSKGDIYCAYCKYHKGENARVKYYGAFSNRKKMRYPSWKLASKKKKQWGPRGYTVEHCVSHWGEYHKIMFDRNRHKHLW